MAALNNKSQAAGSRLVSANRSSKLFTRQTRAMGQEQERRAKGMVTGQKVLKSGRRAVEADDHFSLTPVLVGAEL